MRFARLVPTLLLAVTLAAPAAAETGSATEQFVTGAACFVVSPVYGAFKVAFALAGTVVGGLAWAFTGGDTESAGKIWDASLKGTYVISPEHLRGNQPIRFVGR
jgi:hypothetical protein